MIQEFPSMGCEGRAVEAAKSYCMRDENSSLVASSSTDITHYYYCANAMGIQITKQHQKRGQTQTQ